MSTQREYEDRIKAIVKEAGTDGVVWTDKEFARIKDDAVREVSEETARRMFGGGR